MQEKRDIRISLKMTPTVRAYVDCFQGTSFNNKFENCILHFKNTEAELDEKIKEKEARLKMLDAFIKTHAALGSQLHGIQNQLGNLEELLVKVEENCNDVIKFKGV